MCVLKKFSSVDYSMCVVKKFSSVDYSMCVVKNFSSVDYSMCVVKKFSSVDYSMCVVKKPWPVLTPPCLYEALCVGVITIVWHCTFKSKKKVAPIFCAAHTLYLIPIVNSA